MKTVDLTAS